MPLPRTATVAWSDGQIAVGVGTYGGCSMRWREPVCFTTSCGDGRDAAPDASAHGPVSSVQSSGEDKVNVRSRGAANVHERPVRSSVMGGPWLPAIHYCFCLRCRWQACQLQTANMSNGCGPAKCLCISQNCNSRPTHTSSKNTRMVSVSTSLASPCAVQSAGLMGTHRAVCATVPTMPTPHRTCSGTLLPSE